MEIVEGQKYYLKDGSGPCTFVRHNYQNMSASPYSGCEFVKDARGGAFYDRRGVHGGDGHCAALNVDFSRVIAPSFAELNAPRAAASRQERKDTPMFSGFVSYFHLAMAAVSQLSKSANEVHNPGEALHWSKGKSNDHRDCMVRHIADGLDTYDAAPDHDYHYLHAVKNAWRAMAELQVILETGKAARVKKGEL